MEMGPFVGAEILSGISAVSRGPPWCKPEVYWGALTVFELWWCVVTVWNKLQGCAVVLPASIAALLRTCVMS